MWPFGSRLRQQRRKSLLARKQRLSCETLERRSLLTAALAFDDGHSFSFEDFNPGQFVVGHMNGDAYEDLVVSNTVAPYPLDVVLGNGNGTFHYQSTIDPPKQCDDVALGDYNADGKTDVFYLFNTISGTQAYFFVRIYPGNGNGTLAAPLPDVSVNVGNDSYTELEVADFNRDGKADLALMGDPGMALPTGMVTARFPAGWSTLRRGPIVHPSRWPLPISMAIPGPT